jgi:hypothetical protein
MARGEITGRKPKTDKKKRPGKWRKKPPEAAAYTIEEFCAAHRLSPAMYFKLKTQGLGPREMEVGTRKIISGEAAADWRRAREQTSAA